jgi:hypothetical protein
LGILIGGRVWWNFEDRVYASAVFRPSSVRVRVTDSRGVRVTIDGNSDQQRPWIPVIPDHGKLMHLFLVKSDGLGALAHLHPVARDSLTFEAALPVLPAGKYFVFADVVHENGFAETLRDSVTLSAAPGVAWKPSDPDDAAFAGNGTGNPWRFDDGSTLAFDGARAKHVAGAEAGLRFTLRDSHGAVMTIEPYMGMAAHVVVVRNDGKVFEHLHPMGNAPAIGAMGTMEKTFPGTLEFPWAFPSAGQYRVWVQFRIAGSIRTAAFDVTVGA